MLIFKKDDAVKFIDPQSTLIPILRAAGWRIKGEPDLAEQVTEDQSAQDELAALRDKARTLGLEFHPRTGDEKLKGLIAEARP